MGVHVAKQGSELPAPCSDADTGLLLCTSALAAAHTSGMAILKGSPWSPQFPRLELQVAVSELAQCQSGLS